ncbi:MAG: DNA ligase [Sulfurovaceae bacterium]|nr:DNA ligase [Sulfurovaceae bacterium]
MQKIIWFLLLSLFVYAQKPNLLLLKSYRDDINVTNWLMSEKLDGVRAYWDGKRLISRNGKEFASPKWFTKDFPPFEIDGELWTSRNDFENIISIVNRHTPHEEWRDISYQIFELPHQKGGLLKRLEVLHLWLKQNPNSIIKIIPQTLCRDSKHLKAQLKIIESKKGEGLVVREPNTPYIGKRSSTSLKVKSSKDDECVVTGYKKGRGKIKGLVGALICKWRDNKVLNIGSGLSMEERRNPPKIGSEITFKYNGLTRYGNPKFPVFLRVRSEDRGIKEQYKTKSSLSSN